MWCGVVWCGVVWCGVVWCGMVWCWRSWLGCDGALRGVLFGVVGCGLVWFGLVWLVYFNFFCSCFFLIVFTFLSDQLIFKIIMIN